MWFLSEQVTEAYHLHPEETKEEQALHFHMTPLSSATLSTQKASFLEIPIRTYPILLPVPF